MDVIKRSGYFTIYLPRTELNKIKNEYPQVQIPAHGLPPCTINALERLAKKTDKRIDREQKRAARQFNGDESQR